MILLSVYAAVFPELAQFPNHSQMRAAWRESQRRIFWRATTIMYLSLLTGLFIFVKLYVWPFRLLPTYAAAVVLGSMHGLAAVIGTVRMHKSIVEVTLREELIRCGIPVCIRCGYSLEGHKGTCPECGRASGVAG